MKFKFDPGLGFQRDAIQSAVDLLKGQPHGQWDIGTQGQGDLFRHGVGNAVSLSDELLLENTHLIQERNGIPKENKLQGRDFSIEMETGTGKTYVYLRTIFELNKKYGLKKFIIVVPSVAIREGVLKSIDIMRDHLENQYDKTLFERHLYNSKRLNIIRNFRDSNDIQIMIINIQAFQRDVPEQNVDSLEETQQKNLNVIYRDNDRMGGRPIDFIRSTMPIVIIDEPQSVDTTEKSRKAIKQLNPSITLRYSATHRNPYNILYKLGPIEAHEQKLVKRIEIASIHTEDDHSSAYVKYVGGENKTRTISGIRAILEIHKKTASGIKTVRIKAKQYDDLYEKSGGHAPYRQGFIVEYIDITPGAGNIQFNQGQYLKMGSSIGGNPQETTKAMIKETVRQHLEKEMETRNRGIKILSLFFIDKVSNYRTYDDDGKAHLGKIGSWFEDCYKELMSTPRYKDAISFPMEGSHDGYFSKDRRGRLKDTKGNTKDDEDTYSLIMRDKERLLDIGNPLRFIFSHSALREGWDAPNVFQICTLREVGSEVERRQQIGRGLRLPVNGRGERLKDENLNRLTVVSSEGYEEYARALQREYEEDLNMAFGIIEPHAFAKIPRTDESGNETPIGQEASKDIWDGLKKAGHLDDSGKIQDSFAPENDGFNLGLGPKWASLESRIIDIMNKRIFKNKIANAHKRKEVKFKKEVYLKEDFKTLWHKVSRRTRYKVFFTTDEVIQGSLDQIKNMKPASAIKIVSTKASVTLDESGVRAEPTTLPTKLDRIKPPSLPNIVSHIQEQSGLTRRTITSILSRSNRIGEFLINPDLFMENTAKAIRRSMENLMMGGIEYKKTQDGYWRMQRIEEDAKKAINRYIKNLYKVNNRDKSIYDHIDCNSNTENIFAKDLDNNEHVKLFVKLPEWFKIDTPIGPYNPDWAFVTEREEKLYFVRETKSTTDERKLRLEENQKVECGKKHFKEIGVDFDVATSLSEVPF